MRKCHLGFSTWYSEIAHYRKIKLYSEVDVLNQASKTFVQGTIFIGRTKKASYLL